MTILPFLFPELPKIYLDNTDVVFNPMLYSIESFLSAAVICNRIRWNPSGISVL